VIESGYVLPCDAGSLLTINTLVREAPIETAASRPVEDYADADGIVTMWSNCRRVQRIGQPAT
jgi:hypothetical protein